MKSFKEFYTQIEESTYKPKFDKAGGVSKEANELSKSAKTKSEHKAAFEAHLKAGAELHNIADEKHQTSKGYDGAGEFQQAHWHRLKAEEHRIAAGIKNK